MDIVDSSLTTLEDEVPLNKPSSDVLAFSICVRVCVRAPPNDIVVIPGMAILRCERTSKAEGQLVESTAFRQLVEILP